MTDVRSEIEAVTDAAAVTSTAQEILAQGPLDLVVYCAGHYREMRADAFDLAELKRHWSVNFDGDRKSTRLNSSH